MKIEFREGAGSLADRLAAGELSAVDACEAAIAKIERDDPRFNAVVVRDFDRARRAAAEADEALARGERRPLLGVPMTVKEAFDVAGLPTTWGFEHARDHVPGEDAVLVQRLKAAGAVIVGKTNVPVALADWQSENPVYGRTLNPLDARRTPGGSSGGSAAALAAGMVPLELGSDIGGSIRVPAHFCGLYGHKPSHGLLPMRGHDFPGRRGVADPLAVVGPLAHTAADLALAIDLLAGPDGDEAMAWRLALHAPRHRHLADYRIAVIDRHPLAALDADTTSVLSGFVDRLAAAGVHRMNPALPDLAESHRDYIRMLTTIISRGEPEVRPTISAHAWMDLLDRQYAIRERWHAVFDEVDLVVCPVFGTAAFEHKNEPQWRDRSLDLDGRATPFGAQLAWPGIATFAGLPATVMPAGHGRNGMPIGVQLIGPRFEDRTPIEFARLVFEAA